MSDSSYRQRKAVFDRMLTIYGRKPVLEALRDRSLDFYKLHLADSNRREGIIADIETLARQRGIAIEYHDRRALSRISKNGKQDQGVAADLQLASYRELGEWLDSEPELPGGSLIALDRITNPQNLGMIIRSVCASGIRGLLLPKHGCAALSPLVIKASAGSLFNADIFHCERLEDGLRALRRRGATLYTLSSHGSESVFEVRPESKAAVYVLGNETDGVSPAVAELCDRRLCIPMHNGVESLNVAVTAALIAFHAQRE